MQADDQRIMETGFVILSTQKPAKGQPCNGCGYCCQNEACDLSREFLKSSAAPCIALEWDGASRYRCGLMANPSKYLGIAFDATEILAPMFGQMLGIGKGCDAE